LDKVCKKEKDMEVKNFKPMNKGSLIGYLDILFPKLGWTLHGCGYFNSSGKRWVNLPQRTYQDETGKACYADVISMAPEMKNRFSEMALASFDEYQNKSEDLLVEEPPF
jgi:hypothetical protein